MKRFLSILMIPVGALFCLCTLHAQEPLQLGAQFAAGDDVTFGLQFHLTENIAVRPALTLTNLGEKDDNFAPITTNPVHLDLLYYFPMEGPISMFAGLGTSGGWRSKENMYTTRYEVQSESDTSGFELRDSTVIDTYGLTHYALSVFTGVQYSVAEQVSFYGELGTTFTYNESTLNDRITNIQRGFFDPRMRLGMVYYFW